MADKARSQTDKKLERMERRIAEIYQRAYDEIEKKSETFFDRFLEKDLKKRQDLKDGKITAKEYETWRIGQMMTGQHWERMKEWTADELLKANQTATAYVNGQLPGIYALNYNMVGDTVAGSVRGYSFEMVDASTVKNLATSDKTLLPYKYVDGKKDVRWNTQKVNTEVLQGIIQGESIPDIAKRLRNVVGMNRASAVRNARTTTTSAENKGRMDSFHRAQEKGVRIVKVWMATTDERTREEHIELDGQERDIDEPFENSLGEIMYPGDPEADPANVYNCRCTMVTRVVGFGDKDLEEEEPEPEPEAVAQEAQEVQEEPEIEAPEIAGVKRGAPMTPKEADSGHVNPKFSEGAGYRINCQSCCPTYEARLRGYNVEVVPNDAQHPACDTLSKNTSLIWRNADGSPAEYIYGGHWISATDWEGAAPTAKRFEKLLQDNLEEGARYHLGFGWKGYRSGHIVTLTKEPDGLRIYDPQCDRSYSGDQVSAYLGRIKYQTTSYGYKFYTWPEVMRVDDKEFDFDMASQIMRGVGE